MTPNTALLRTSRASQKTEPREEFASAVLAGLTARPRVLPARFFYDHAGSELFEAITRLPEYYLTRAETALLERHAGAIAEAVGASRAVIEFGSGSSTKTPLLLRAVAPSAYVPIDISGEFLLSAAEALRADMPGLAVLPVVGDFTETLDLPTRVRARPLLGFFPGSTIGNLSHGAAVDLLRRFRLTLGAGAWLAIGIDTRKDVQRLLAAYDDAQGVTAAFNLNVLRRVNTELAGTLPLDAFEHEAIWNDGLGRIEMHLRARCDITASVLGRRIDMGKGESIHTENSYKYTLAEARLLAHASGWTAVEHWTDAEGSFGLHLWRADSGRMEP